MRHIDRTAKGPSAMYNDVNLFIDGAWTAPEAGKMLVVINPATGEPAGKVAHAERADLDRALESTARGFQVWKKVNAYERSKIMRKAANLLRERAAMIAGLGYHLFIQRHCQGDSLDLEPKPRIPIV